MQKTASLTTAAALLALAVSFGATTALAVPPTFSYSSRDLVAEFRQTGSADLTIDLGSIDTFTALSPGQTISLTSRYSIADQLLTTFSSLDSLTFSVIGTHKVGLVNSTEPVSTTWLTSPRTDVNVQTMAPNRYSNSTTQGIQSAVSGILGDGSVKGALVYAPNASYAPSGPSSAHAIVIPTTGVDAVNSYTSLYTGTGGLKSKIASPGIENTTPANFSSSGGVIRSDLYAFQPGTPSAKAQYLGSFTFDTTGLLTYTSVPEPSDYGLACGTALFAGALLLRRRRAVSATKAK